MNIINTIFSYLGIALWVFGLYLVFLTPIRGLLLKSAKTLWQKKYLLLIAFFAGMTAYGGEVNFLFRQIDTVGSIQKLLDNVRTAITNGTWSSVVRDWNTLWSHSTAMMSGYAVITLLLTAMIIWLIITSQAAIVRIAGRVQQGKPAGLVDGITTGINSFWSLLQLNAIGLLAGWSTWVILTGIPAAIYLLHHGSMWSSIAYIGSIIAILVSLVIIYLVQFATAGMVLNGQRLMPAIVDSWKLFIRNIVPSVEMAIAIFTVNVTISFLVLGELFFFVSPFTLAGFLFIVAIIVLIYALLSGFSFVAWTGYYLQLTAGKTFSKLGQWTTQLVNFASQKRGTI
jgi:hypothetical protein